MTDPRARDLRQNPTDAEGKLWAHLRLGQVHGHKFRPHAASGPIGPPMPHRGLEERLVIEVDGSQHLKRALLDARRDESLESLGFRVLRFWDNQVLNETDAIIEVIAQKREEGPHPCRGEASLAPTPANGGRDLPRPSWSSCFRMP